MKAYLVVSGTLFALFAGMHFYIAYEHWRAPAPAPWSGLGPALVGLASAALAYWAFRLSRSFAGPAA
jgi:shikimate kinase